MADADNSILEENLFFLTGAFSRRLSKESDEAFASFGLSTSHALILLIVRKEPEIQPSEIAKKLHLKPSTITRLVNKLETRQLVEKKSKGRATSIVCTGKGIDMSSSIQERWKELLDAKREELGERYVEVLSEMISNAIETLSDSEDS